MAELVDEWKECSAGCFFEGNVLMELYEPYAALVVWSFGNKLLHLVVVSLLDGTGVLLR